MDTLNVNIAKVFVDDKGEFGNPVGIVLNENKQFSDEQKQQVATKLNFSETVFIDSLEKTPIVSIFNPQHKVKFAGHAVLGTAYFIKHSLDKDIDSIKCWDENVAARFEEDKTYVTAPLSIMPAWNYEQLDSTNQVERLSKEEITQKKHVFVWAWIDEIKGLIRARTFAPDWGIPEDQANGSGSILLATKLKKQIEILHGQGSVIYARPIGSNLAEVGGLVKLGKKIELRNK
ncbi:hypothetical protein A2630_02690 [Candidatus Woesebacteria bacterium RIFCSPHIGHO2_01_FULL_44_10]|uniref:Phenazine biosynthesis protein PhzF n=1 Tax=Candidatus Woesebacteria bacterium RIFCSPLOWO2_01_FULL_44_14 TaxID=1802525 RepID=A0A1F8C468_9BACT|nr:MAG: hypothetical protein A2630_02690 [Candidatus Woesebacteria bacterium RIFCSPHIGHO2_01_FULL_44_10]OGM56147.1 MAG: hypothetical protein A3F62_00760 [Candidatus Woesebacteria bacterium RIFCSPHIGHO2_12_FULL_44_11]OGM70950.1 MAG: hypothetical protein A2975_01605 [Candidatus Woesebacteria bacterium RIFCSPLOWO2_01_FULL_44_14]